MKKESIEKFVQGQNNNSTLNRQQSNSSLGAGKSPRDVNNKNGLKVLDKMSLGSIKKETEDL